MTMCNSGERLTAHICSREHLLRTKHQDGFSKKCTFAGRTQKVWCSGKTPSFHLVPGWPLASCSASLCLAFLIWKYGEDYSKAMVERVIGNMYKVLIVYSWPLNIEGIRGTDVLKYPHITLLPESLTTNNSLANIHQLHEQWPWGSKWRSPYTLHLDLRKEDKGRGKMMRQQDQPRVAFCYSPLSLQIGGSMDPRNSFKYKSRKPLKGGFLEMASHLFRISSCLTTNGVENWKY